MNIPFHTRTGIIDLGCLRSQDLTAEALGEAMAKINRFGGRTPEPWSVAAHSLLVEALCPPDLRGWALLHDAHKVFLGDLMDPSVELICQSGTRLAVENAIANAEAKVDRAIAAAWGIALRSKSEALLSACQIAFMAEVWTFMQVQPGRLSPHDADLLDRAVQFLRENPHLAWGDWRPVRDHWVANVKLIAKTGRLAPPSPIDPSSAVLAG
ncbi:hypothetical protein [Fuscovulum blasticum]|uniref:hypothetical protein n=1 Tax=Fuscovulum blasticum TaxID=1075 RepID=UPI000D3EBB43|nr:hypothetical protein [Fuscovulum blasticum]AWD21590.1 hypothetical protein B6K69_07810 [Fuscovulum blasticum]